MRGLIRRPFKKSLVVFFIPVLLCLFLGEAMSQPVSKEDTGPQIELGEITFRTREFESKPQPLKILEVQIEVLNRSRQFAAPSHSVKVVLVAKEIQSSEQKPVKDFEPASQEATLNVPIPARTGRALTIGFSLPQEKLASITFEIQINPPEGAKKTATWIGE